MAALVFAGYWLTLLAAMFVMTRGGRGACEDTDSTVRGE